MQQRDELFESIVFTDELDVLRALADAERLSLVRRLLQGSAPQTLSSLAEGSAVHLSGVSRHLAVLERAGIVRRHKRGREVHHAVNASHVVDVLRRLSAAFEAAPAAAVPADTESQEAPPEPAWPASVPAWAPIDED